ncbi:bifunctional PIG-L family deacetylase/class I SAM-dependent methyltransferase [Glaciibacter psychrotolerans]|uniref:LmbE family N-acetylglucosaminyl deacetylase/protein-L-isoaspartate O-methyltransferase n=1 Tax=Glaciibacter psychrotolerans TaxID=670054 RepID=A0A7Z0EG49_9MICO|nr:LmbE family N-acetylglucosaminyl deacetylase/protein-L-isoaspartate O-methyltransferase [Leifsonia psychrotolerans]
MSFDHQDTGTLEAEWVRSPRLSELQSLDLDGLTHLVVLSAHPDDETLGAAGLIARAAGCTAQVSIVVATDGENSHPRSPTCTAAQLSALRRSELREAIGNLAPAARIEFLGIPDGQLREYADTVRHHLTQLVGRHGPEGLVLVAPWVEDGHRDHRAAGMIARAAAHSTGARLVEYPIWMWHWADPDNAAVPWNDMVRLELTEVEHAVKSKALSAHRSQIFPLSDALGDEVLLNPEVQRHFSRPFEVFIVPPGASHQTLESLPEAFFDHFYTGKADPWGVETRWYEERKRAITLASLPRKQFRSGLEIGCSIGVLTGELATRCDAVLAIDISEAPLALARKRLGAVENIAFVRLTTPDQWPDDTFDLIVLSEVGYYWDEAALGRALDKALASLTPDGILLACHWRHPVAEYPLGGDEVHAALRERSDLALLVHHSEDDFLLDVFSRPPGRSVATVTGLV